MTPNWSPLALLVTLAFTVPCGDAFCDNCEGKWWPLFKPSQLISSEFPEHAQYRSQGYGKYLAHDRFSQEGVGAVDTPVRAYNSHGKHRVEWDHFGDLSRVATVAHNSLEDRAGPRAEGQKHANSEETGLAQRAVSRASFESVETVKTSLEDHGGAIPQDIRASIRKDHGGTSAQDNRAPIRKEDHGGTSAQGNRAPIRKEDHESTHDISVSAKSEEGSFFNDGSFFEDTFSPSVRDPFTVDFDASKASSFSNEFHDTSNSIEIPSSFEAFGGFDKKPVATSYSAMSSIFTPANPIYRQSKDLLHPDLTFNDVSKYINNQAKVPVSLSKFFNGKNLTKQYLVHEPQHENHGMLRINHVPPSRLATVRGFVPVDHPVYRYTQGMRNFQSPSGLRLQFQRPELRNTSPFMQMRHQTVVHHVIPTKNPFADSVWKETKMKPPPFAQNLYFFKKKPIPMDLKKIAKRQGPNYVYFVKSNQRLR